MLQGASGTIHEDDGLIGQLDDAFRPSVQAAFTRASTQPFTVDGAKDDDAAFLSDIDIEMVQHDDARGVFRTHRPSFTLAELQEREAVDNSRQGADDEPAPGDSAIRGGVFGGNPWDDLWTAEKIDAGSDASRFQESADLEAEAHKVWEEAAVEKHDDIDWEDGDDFHDSEMEDLVLDDSDLEDSDETSSEEAFIEDGWNDEARHERPCSP
ncbi:hypothetical protein Daus18300_001350 [Diaporthe australafricana]|uniref:CCD97-like C-terminal domain-containing protein n=1 Tax=Diaporthe australafricana TaxID=127596 RepID=A0ABR3XYK8_9PEZI